MDDQELPQVDSFKQISIDPNLRDGFMLGDVLVFPNRGVIVRQHEHHHVSPKAMEVLFVLCCCAGQIVSRKAILGYVWGSKRTASSAISPVISELRHLLDDHKECPTYIQTLPRKGYRLLLPPLPMQDSLLTSGALKAAAYLDDDSAEQPSSRLLKGVEHWRHSHLFKVAGTYIVMAWILIQVVAVAIPVIDAPQWLDKVALIALVLGFPCTLGYHWYAEFTLRKRFARKHNSPEVEQKIGHHAYRELGGISVLALCSVSIVLILGNQLMSVSESQFEADPQGKIRAQFYPNAVAVMPFETLGKISADYSITLLQSEMSAFLSQSQRLKIISERVLDAIPPDSSLATIREWTGAKYILEGKVNQLADTLRVTTSLTDSESGHQIWANTMQVELANQLSFYARISQQVANALTFILPDENADALQFKPTDDIHAYDFYIRAKMLLRDAYNQQQFKQAAQLFLNALQRDSQFALAQLGLCQAYLEQYVLIMVPQIFEQARQACQSSATNEANHAEYYLASARLYFVSGEYMTANQFYTKAIELRPDNSVAIIGKAQALNRLKQPKQAESLFLNAINAEPGYWRNYEEYGRFLFESGRYYEASLQFEKQTVLSPDSEEAFNNLGAAHYLNAKFELATASYKKALALKPSANIYSNLGTSLFFSRQFAQAADMYSKAVELSEGQFFLRGNYADALKFADRDSDAHLQHYRIALQQAQASLQINPNDIVVKASEARYLSELGSCPQAIQIADQLLLSRSADPYIYYDLALVANNCNHPSAVLERIRLTVQQGYSVKLLLADPQFAAVKSEIQQNFSVAGSPI